MVEVVILVEVAIAIEPVVLVLEGFFRPFYGNSANTLIYRILCREII